MLKKTAALNPLLTLTSKIVKKTAKEFNLPYNEYKTMTKAVAEHFRHLGVLGQKPELA